MRASDWMTTKFELPEHAALKKWVHENGTF
jgi:hypothetical protein